MVFVCIRTDLYRLVGIYVFLLIVMFVIFSLVLQVDQYRSQHFRGPGINRYRDPVTGDFLPEYSHINNFYTQSPSTTHPLVPQSPLENLPARTPTSPASSPR